jgi:hypothetical protein
MVAGKYNKGDLIVIPTTSRHPDSRGSHPRLSEAKWRDLLFVEGMNRSLHCASQSLPRAKSRGSAPVGMTIV